MAKWFCFNGFAAVMIATRYFICARNVTVASAIAAAPVADEPACSSTGYPIDDTGTVRKHDWIIANVNASTGDGERKGACRIRVPF
jgi:hypothetical protein